MSAPGAPARRRSASRRAKRRLRPTGSGEDRTITPAAEPATRSALSLPPCSPPPGQAEGQDDGKRLDPPLDCDRRRRPGALGADGAPADSRCALVLSPAGESGHHRAQHPASAPGAGISPDEAASPHRPPGLRPRGRGGARSRSARDRHPARGADSRGGALRPRDRALVQRLPLLPHRLPPRAPDRAPPLPCPPGIRGRPGAVAHRARGERGVRHEPPQQCRLRDRGVHGGEPLRAQLRGGRMGESLAPAGPRALSRSLLRTPQFQQRALPAGSRALRAGGNRGRGGPGRLPRGGPEPRRPHARAEARPHQLHDQRLRSRGRARSGLRPGGHQLRPGARGPFPRSCRAAPVRMAASTSRRSSADSSPAISD